VKPSVHRNPFTGRIHYDSLIMEYIKKYQETLDVQMWHNVFSKLGLLILRMIWQERRKYRKELRGVKNQELYHISYICLGEAMRKFDTVNFPLYTFPRFLQRHIQKEVRKLVADRKKYLNCGLTAAAFRTGKTGAEKAEDIREGLINRIEVKDAMAYIVKRYKIPEIQLKAFYLWCEGKTYQKIAEQSGRSKARVHVWVKRIIGRLKNRIKEADEG
jgi:hypothetical protein